MFPNSQFHESKTIAGIIDGEGPFDTLLSLWCNSCHVESHSTIPKKVLTDDRYGRVDLLYRVHFQRWRPPVSLSQDEWNLLRTYKDDLKPALSEFCGYAYTQNGRFWHTYLNADISLGTRAWRSLLRTGNRLDKNSESWTLLHRNGFHFPYPALQHVRPDERIAAYIRPPEDMTHDNLIYMWREIQGWLQEGSHRTVFMSLPEDVQLRYVKKWELPTVYTSDNIYMMEGDIRLAL